MLDNFNKKEGEEKEEKGEQRDKRAKGVKWIKWGIFLLAAALIFLAVRNWANLPKVKEDNGRVNLVFLGIGGNDQKPADLTDTIFFLSFNKKNGKTLILSIPRDIWLTSLQAKINTAYHYGGFSLVKSSVQEILEQPVHYLAVLDFEGFKKVVDFLGGVEIYVRTAFDDYKYPIPGKENDNCGGDKEFKCRYEHLYFNKGWEKMNGERALKYVRSRNAEGEEGTDLARNLRQQNFLLALKDKVLSPKVYLNPQKIFGLVRLFPSLLKTDLKQEEYFTFLLSFLKFDTKKIEMKVLNGNNEEEFLLYHPQKHSSGQWVLLPIDDNWGKAKDFIKQNLP